MSSIQADSGSGSTLDPFEITPTPSVPSPLPITIAQANLSLDFVGVYKCPYVSDVNDCCN